MHPLDYRDYRDRSKTLEELTIATGQQLILGGDAHPQIVQVGFGCRAFLHVPRRRSADRTPLPPAGGRAGRSARGDHQPRSLAVSLRWRSGRCRADGRTELAARGDRRRPAARVPARAAGGDICASRLGRLAAGADQLHAAAAQEPDRVHGFRAAGAGRELRAGAGGAEPHRRAITRRSRRAQGVGSAGEGHSVSPRCGQGRAQRPVDAHGCRGSGAGDRLRQRRASDAGARPWPRSRAARARRRRGRPLADRPAGAGRKPDRGRRVVARRA